MLLDFRWFICQMRCNYVFEKSTKSTCDGNIWEVGRNVYSVCSNLSHNWSTAVYRNVTSKAHRITCTERYNVHKRLQPRGTMQITPPLMEH